MSEHINNRQMLAKERYSLSDVSISVQDTLGRVTVSDFAYYLALGTWIFFNILHMSFFATRMLSLYRYVRLACIVIVLFSEAARMRITPKSLVAMFALLALVLIAWHINQKVQIDALIFIWGARNRNRRSLLTVPLLSMTAAFLLVLFAARAGVITNYFEITYSGRRREYLGFRYALYPSAAMLGITCAGVCLARDKGYVKTLLFLAVANWLVYDRTNSRLSFILALLVVILSLIYRSTEHGFLRGKTFGVIARSSFVVCAAVSIFLTLNYRPDSELMLSLNQTLGSRLRLGQMAFQRYRMTLLGTSMSGDVVGNGLNVYGEHVAGDYFYIDCLYVRFLLEGGLLLFIAYLAAMTFLMREAWSSQDHVLVGVLFCLALHGLVDNLMMNLFYNPMLLLAGAMLSESLSTTIRVRHGKSPLEQDRALATGYQSRLGRLQ